MSPQPPNPGSRRPGPLHTAPAGPLAASLTAATLWGVFPVLIAVGALTPGAAGPAFTVWLNAAGGLAALLFGCLGPHRPLARLAGLLRAPRRLALLVANAGFIALANTLAFLALAGEGRIVSALVLDAWPILAALLLPLAVPGYTRWRWRQAPALLLALTGFALMHRTGAADTTALALALLSTLCQVATVCLHQRLVANAPIALSAREMLVLQGIRMVLASAIALPLALVWGGSAALLAPSAGTLAASVCAGLLITLSALLSTWSLERSRAPSLALAWLLAPAVTIALLAVFGLDRLSLEIAIGSALVLSALALDLRTRGQPRTPD